MIIDFDLCIIRKYLSYRIELIFIKKKVNGYDDAANVVVYLVVWLIICKLIFVC